MTKHAQEAVSEKDTPEPLLERKDRVKAMVDVLLGPGSRAMDGGEIARILSDLESLNMTILMGVAAQNPEAARDLAKNVFFAQIEGTLDRLIAGEETGLTTVLRDRETEH